MRRSERDTEPRTTRKNMKAPVQPPTAGQAGHKSPHSTTQSTSNENRNEVSKKKQHRARANTGRSRENRSTVLFPCSVPTRRAPTNQGRWATSPLPHRISTALLNGAAQRCLSWPLDTPRSAGRQELTPQQVLRVLALCLGPTKASFAHQGKH